MLKKAIDMELTQSFPICYRICDVNVPSLSWRGDGSCWADVSVVQPGVDIFPSSYVLVPDPLDVSASHITAIKKAVKQFLSTVFTAFRPSGGSWQESNVALLLCWWPRKNEKGRLSAIGWISEFLTGCWENATSHFDYSSLSTCSLWLFPPSPFVHWTQAVMTHMRGMKTPIFI